MDGINERMIRWASVVSCVQCTLNSQASLIVYWKFNLKAFTNLAKRMYNKYLWIHIARININQSVRDSRYILFVLWKIRVSHCVAAYVCIEIYIHHMNNSYGMLFINQIYLDMDQVSVIANSNHLPLTQSYSWTIAFIRWKCLFIQSEREKKFVCEVQMHFQFVWRSSHSYSCMYVCLHEFEQNEIVDTHNNQKNLATKLTYKFKYVKC